MCYKFISIIDTVKLTGKAALWSKNAQPIGVANVRTEPTSTI